MSNRYGKNFTYISFGESHGKAVGCVIDGIKPGIEIDETYIQDLLDKRRPGQSKITSQRDEKDKIEILSGVFEGKTTGHPVCIITWNKDARSKDYENIKNLFRPGHADYTFHKKYGIRDYRGGGRQSARVLVANVMAGAIAKKELEKKGIEIIAYVKQVGTIKAKKIDLSQINRNIIKCPDKEAAKKIEELIMQSKQNTQKKGDSFGCLIEVIAQNVPAGLGAPQANKLNAEIAKALMSINAAKAVEIGIGFDAVELLGSENNDIFIKENKIKTKTNNSGGILGGISNGMPIVARLAIKPASSIYQEQETIDIKGASVKYNLKGRHDPCPGLRAVPIVEAMLACVIYDAWLENQSIKE